MHTGSCLCGGVAYRVSGQLRTVKYCHCSQCRKTTGHFAAATSCSPDALRLEADKTLSWYRSSEEAERGFCKRCGGQLFWKPLHGGYIAILAGTLDVPTGLSGDSHIFVADKSDYYDINDDLPQFPHDGRRT